MDVGSYGSKAVRDPIYSEDRNGR